ncbi:hypothetical protein L484_006142 [Morus notabilis]|uniref:TCP domain-containing protein n=1 Tax=Morus notabilis TaxID=981085 RepID=W9RZN4_9ROSA|nr:transcription factor TCP4 [Morus notabilis]XP_024029269.1 transcription factor TCP4 [Morus notabilis]EXC19447.1 hypothetical protein L484_006142 [Morus notabilis]
MMSYYLLDSVPHQILQQRELKDDEKEEKARGQDRDQAEEEDEEGEQGQGQQMIFGKYQHVQLPLCDKRYDIDYEKSCRKLCYSKQLALEKHRIVKFERGERRKQASARPSSKPTQENEAGDALQVHGGHVVRFIKKKERHNKVCTSKGPRDRRVRLSAHTAIQFYDVQDRLGYDQPTKAIDWLIEKAKAAIEALAELPAQNNDSFDTTDCVTQPQSIMRDKNLYPLQYHQGCDNWPQKISLGSTSKCDKEEQLHLNNEGIFSMVSQFQDYPTEQNSTQGLCLSLQSSEDQDLYLHHSSPIDFDEQALNSMSSLTDSTSIDTGRFQSLMAINSSAGNEGAQFFFNSLPSLLQQPFLRENQF